MAEQPGEAVHKRVESDAMGEILVPAEHYWGAQTERSLHHFAIGEDRMPLAICHALGYIKKASAIVNARRHKLTQENARLIIQAADEVICGRLDSEFPLYVWQTGSGTQTNMNVNEVVSNRAIELAGGTLGSKTPIHPNDHVNMSQSSNDTFPAAMHIAAVLALTRQLLPEVTVLREALAARAELWRDVVKIGRTHLQDAVPLTVGQEWSGYVAALDDGLARVRQSLSGLYPLALGGTAVGTGLDSPRGFDVQVAAEIADLTGEPFVTAPNKFAALSGIDGLVASMSAVRGLAVSLYKIAQDIRWLGSGPRAGIGELQLPENEPGSSIMPGKVNPTQSEAMIMVCIQVMADDQAVAFAGSQGNFELNVARPVAINAYLRSVRILSDACHSFREFCIEGIELDRETIQKHVLESLMLVTALKKPLGYDKAGKIAKHAHHQHLTLKEGAAAFDVSDEDFDRWVVPENMVHPEDDETEESAR
jgi:fumarate hydratase, class II